MRKPVHVPLQQLAPYLIEVQTPLRSRVADRLPAYSGKKPLDWLKLFGNANPVEIEVGFGKGLFLVNAGGVRPEVNFFGIEKERAYTLFTATRLCKRGIGNVKLVCADARSFLREWVADSSVQALHIYFPDPWWKKRHHKRRLFSGDFAREVVRVLGPHGQLHFATDVAAYFEEVMPMLRAFTHFEELPAPSAQDPRHDMDYLTNFERKARKLAKPIHRAVLLKKTEAARRPDLDLLEPE